MCFWVVKGQNLVRFWVLSLTRTELTWFLDWDESVSEYSAKSPLKDRVRTWTGDTQWHPWLLLCCQRNKFFGPPLRFGSKQFVERVRHHGGFLDGPEAVDEDVHLGLDRDAWKTQRTTLTQHNTALYFTLKGYFTQNWKFARFATHHYVVALVAFSNPHNCHGFSWTDRISSSGHVHYSATPK